MNYWNSVILSLWIVEFLFVWFDKNMSFWFYKSLKLITSEYLIVWQSEYLSFCIEGNEHSKTDGGRAMEGMATLLAGSQIGWKMAGTLAISVEMTNFEGKKCWNYADIRTILSADLCHHERHRSGYQACCKARYAAFGGIRPHCKAVDRPKEFRKGIGAWRRFGVPGFASFSGVWL